MLIRRNSSTKRILEHLDYYIDVTSKEQMPLFKIRIKDFNVLLKNVVVPARDRKIKYRDRDIEYI